MRIRSGIAELVDANPGRKGDSGLRRKGPIPESDPADDRTLLRCQSGNTDNWKVKIDILKNSVLRILPNDTSHYPGERNFWNLGRNFEEDDNLQQVEQILKRKTRQNDNSIEYFCVLFSSFLQTLKTRSIMLTFIKYKITKGMWQIKYVERGPFFGFDCIFIEGRF